MGTIIPILAVVILLGIFGSRLNKKEEDDVEFNPYHDEAVASMYESAHQSAEETHKNIEEQMKQDNNPDTLGLMFNTLTILGCQPKKNDDDTISVSYQGENFQMEFGGMYCRVWDPMWSGIKVDDPELPQVKEAVNAANFNFGPTVVMTAPDENGVIGFHSRRDIMLHPACPDNVPFVKAVLDSFFDAKENVRNKFQQLNAQQAEAQKRRRPIGFTTNSANTQTEE